MINTKILQDRIAGRAPEYLHELFGDEVKAAGSDRWRVGSRGSLAIDIKDGALVFYSHEDGAGGDAIALWRRQRGGSIGEALRAAAAWAQVPDDAPVRSGRTRRRRPVPQRAPHAEQTPLVPPAGASPLRMTEPQFQLAHAMSRRLAEDDSRCERIAQARGWQARTIRDLALDGALGWSEPWPGYHQGALAFCYESGIKHRWCRGRDRERMIRWFCGGPRTLWRSWMVLHLTETVIITEGETDAIALIDSGAEASLTDLVVALPNAGVVPHGLAELVRGRTVLLCLDHDPAGQAARKKITPIIQSTAKHIGIWTTPK